MRALTQLLTAGRGVISPREVSHSTDKHMADGRCFCYRLVKLDKIISPQSFPLRNVSSSAASVMEHASSDMSWGAALVSTSGAPRTETDSGTPTLKLCLTKKGTTRSR